MSSLTQILLEAAGMHDLRHFGQRADPEGAVVKCGGEAAGHAKAEITLRVYSHLWPDDDDRTRAAIDSVFGHGQNADVPHVRPVDVASS